MNMILGSDHRTLPALLAALGLSMVLSSCSFFSSKEVSVDAVAQSKLRDYFRNELINPDGLAFDSENFLRGNLLQNDYSKNPDGTLLHLEEYYRLSGDTKYLAIAADLCRWLAVKSAPNEAVKFHLSTLYYCRRALYADFAKQNSESQGVRDFGPFRLVLIYNEACCGLFDYLKKNDLLDKSGFTLKGCNGRDFTIERSSYHLSIPVRNIEDFSLCPNYTIESLMLKNRRSGIGVPLVARVSNRQLYRSLRTPNGLTLPVTMTLRMRDVNPNTLGLSFLYQDTTLKETLDIEDVKLVKGNWPLALDFSTPMACFLNELPDQNLIATMLNADTEEKNTGLYMVEPYNPHKIPVVFIHGLMSGPGTWVQMINSLKNDANVRKHYQFWFFYYSSGTPIVQTAATLRQALLEAEKEFATTPEARANFNRMVLVGHSMGGLVTRTLLQKNPYEMLETITQLSWAEITKKLTPEEIRTVEKIGVFPSLPFVHRAIFLAVPHRGADMAKMPIARFGSKIIKLPQSLLQRTRVIKLISQKLGINGQPDDMINHFYTGIDNLDPQNRFISALGNSQMKDDLIYHSIIGNNKKDNTPGGSDGVVPYSSSHLNLAASELVVHSWHSVHRTPAAIREVLRILLLHLQENNVRK